MNLGTAVLTLDLTNQFPGGPNLGKHRPPPSRILVRDGSDVGLLLGSQELMTEAITSSATVTSNEFSGDCQIRPSILRQKLLSPNYCRIRQIRYFPREKSDLSVCCCGVDELLGVLLLSGKWAVVERVATRDYWFARNP